MDADAPGRLTVRQALLLAGFIAAVIAIGLAVRAAAPPADQIILATPPTQTGTTGPVDDITGPAVASTPPSSPRPSTPVAEEGRPDTQPDRDAEDLAVAEAFVVAVVTGDDATRARLAEGPPATPPPPLVGSSGRPADAGDVEIVQMTSHVLTGQGDRSIIQVLADLTSPAGDSIGQWRVAVTRRDGRPVVNGLGAG